MEQLDHLVTIGEAILDAINDLKADKEIPMTRQQAAVYVGCSPSTIANYVAQGKLTKKVKQGIAGYLPSDLRKLRK